MTRHTTCRSVMIVISVCVYLLSASVSLEAEAWLNRHIVEMRSDRFVLQTRFYRYIVHTDDTKCVARSSISRCPTCNFTIWSR
jgi:hypothetical protein